MSHDFEDENTHSPAHTAEDTLDLAIAPAIPVLSIAEVTDTEHPTLSGRVCCRIACGGEKRVQIWLPTLRGLCIRTGDRVIVTMTQNYAEAIVTGVLDGFRERPNPQSFTGASLALLPDEKLSIHDSRDHRQHRRPRSIRGRCTTSCSSQPSGFAVHHDAQEPHLFRESAQRNHRYPLDAQLARRPARPLDDRPRRRRRSKRFIYLQYPARDICVER